MEIHKSDIVKSTAGRDKEYVFIVLDVQGQFLMLADGKLRKVEKPKRKKIKHTKLITVVNSPLRDKITNGEQVLNSEIRKTLSRFVAQVTSEDQA